METAPFIPHLSLDQLLKKELKLNTSVNKFHGEVFKIPSGTEHLFEVMDKLPQDCIFNKGRVGGGGTTIALRNSLPTIICVPTVELIENKIAQSLRTDKKHLFPHELIGIYSKKGRDQVPGESLVSYILNVDKFTGSTEGLENYLDANPAPKIMVTYNSLPRLLEFIKLVGPLNPKDFHLLIDEWHMLLTEYGYRDEAIRGVFACYKECGSHTFMSSTPVEEEFIPDQMKSIPVVKAEWEDVQPTTVKLFECKGSDYGPKGIIDIISWGIQNCLATKPTDERPYNLYIFVNHVDYINDMIKKNNLDPGNCRVIMSKTNPKELPGSFKIGSIADIEDDPKRINFLTSTGFEGSDIYDPIGCIIAVSDGNKEHTLIDLHTKFLQISRRIRNSLYSGHIDHVVSLKRSKSEITEEQFVNDKDKKEEDEKALFETYKSIPQKKDRIRTVESYKPRYHFVTKEGNIGHDPNKKKKYLYDFTLSNDMYKSSSNLIEKYRNNGIEFTGISVLVPLSTDNFKVVVNNLLEHKLTFGTTAPSYIQMRNIAYSKYDFLEEAIDKIGFEGIISRKYKTNTIKRTLKTLRMKNSPNNDYSKIARALDASGKFKNGVTVPSKEAKRILQEIYSSLTLSKNATARQIMDYYHAQEKGVRNGGNVEKSIYIQTPKFSVN